MSPYIANCERKCASDCIERVLPIVQCLCSYILWDSLSIDFSDLQSLQPSIESIDERRRRNLWQRIARFHCRRTHVYDCKLIGDEMHIKPPRPRQHHLDPRRLKLL